MSPRTTDEALRRLLEQGRARAAATDPDHARLWEALAAATEGGKRFRPALVHRGPRRARRDRPPPRRSRSAPRSSCCTPPSSSTTTSSTATTSVAAGPT